MLYYSLQVSNLSGEKYESKFCVFKYEDIIKYTKNGSRAVLPNLMRTEKAERTFCFFTLHSYTHTVRKLRSYKQLCMICSYENYKKDERNPMRLTDGLICITKRARSIGTISDRTRRFANQSLSFASSWCLHRIVQWHLQCNAPNLNCMIGLS